VPSRPPLYPHQEVAVAFLQEKRYVLLGDDMGLGKSRSLIEALETMPGLDGCVLVMRKPLIQTTWCNEYDGQFVQWSNGAEVLVYEPGARGIKTLKKFAEQPPKRFRWLVINYEAFRKKDVQQYLIKAMKSQSLAMACDESTAIKNRSAKQTKGVMEVGFHCRRRICMSGTPIDRNPLDLWSQCNFLGDKLIGPYGNYYAYRNSIMSRFKVQNNDLKIVTFDKVEMEKIARRMESFCLRRLKEEVIEDLPDKIFQTREVPMTTEQERVYKEMATQLYTEFEGQEFEAVVMLTKLLRLSQITSGFCESTSLGASPKLEELMEILNESSGKVVVFCKFHGEIDMIRERLQKENIGFVEFHGKNVTTRGDSAYKFTSDDNIRVCLAQVETGGIGLNLQAAHTMVFFNNDWRYGVRDQAEDRIHRIGQPNHCTIIDLMAVTAKGGKTINHYVKKVIETKEQLSTFILDNFREITIGTK